MNLLSTITIIAGFIDAWKYLWQASKIKKNRSSRDISRKFLLAGIGTHSVIISYTITKMDIPMLVVWVSGLTTLLVTYYYTWKYYPYLKRKCRNFKRPNILIFTLNVIIPNKFRKHL